jgi:hypothetical protein
VFATSCNRGRRAQNTVATRGLVSTGTGRGGGGSIGWLDPGSRVMSEWLIQVMDLQSITLDDE